MSKSVSVNRVKHPRYKFRVYFPETVSDGTAKRRESFFSTKAEAEAFAKTKQIEVTNHGTRHGNVENEELAALIRYREWAANRPEAPSISELIQNAIKAHETARQPLTVSQAIDARIDAADRRDVSARHQGDLKCRLDRFRAKFGERQISSVTLTEIETWLHRLDVAPQTWTNYARVIGSVFALAVKRGFLAVSPCTSLERPKIKRKAPAILTPAQLSKLLTAAAPELRPLLVLQAFCGLRRAEAGRLSWSHVHLDASPAFVEIPSEVTKTNRRRVCEILPAAAAWLKPMAGLPGASLGLTDTVYNDRLRDAATDAKIKWTENLLRHSFGTYRLAATKNAAAVAEEMGNSPNVVRTHYQNVTSPEQAAAWWKVLPSISLNTVPFPTVKAS